MNRDKLLHDLDNIIDIGIVNAKHDSDVLRQCRKLLKKMDWHPADQPPKDARFVLAVCKNNIGEKVYQIAQHIGKWHTSAYTMQEVMYHVQVLMWTELPEMPEVK